jgi:hypothetical protein
MKCPPRFDNFPRTTTLDYGHEHILQCSQCKQKYRLVWDDKEWNYITTRFAPRRGGK